MTTYATLLRSNVTKHYFPMLLEGIEQIGDQQVRNRGPIAGSVAHSAPAADMPGMVLALRADIIVQGTEGARIIKADAFFLNPVDAALQPGELITQIAYVA